METVESSSYANSAPTQTPLYYVLNEARYRRQELIRQAQEILARYPAEDETTVPSRRKLLVYFANIQHPYSAINAEDITPFQEMLIDCQRSRAYCADLLIQSGGGDIDTAEKLVMMLRQQLPDGFRVIVAERAKSAATLIALASDAILMSDTSELGPIDPQIPTRFEQGIPVWRPAQSFLDGLKHILEETAQNGMLNPAYFPILTNIDPALIDMCEKAILRSKGFAERWLKHGMHRNNPNKAAEVAARLCDTQQYTSHGAVISYIEARDELGLNVLYVPADAPVWNALWMLYTTYVVHAAQYRLRKVFETDTVSVQLASGAE